MNMTVTEEGIALRIEVKLNSKIIEAVYLMKYLNFEITCKFEACR